VSRTDEITRAERRIVSGLGLALAGMVAVLAPRDLGGTGDELEVLATTLNDMLDRVAAATERERTFLDDASHELRTPVTLLQGELELAADERDPEAMRAGVDRAMVAAARLAAMADDLLVLARQEAGRTAERHPSGSAIGWQTSSSDADVRPARGGRG
jgi:signal transduction histidine kinase